MHLLLLWILNFMLYFTFMSSPYPIRFTNTLLTRLSKCFFLRTRLGYICFYYGNIWTVLKFTVLLKMSKRGRPLLVYKKYTYSKYPYPLKAGWRWYCSRVKNCRASILMTDDNCVIAATGRHNHGPPDETNCLQMNIPILCPKYYGGHEWCAWPCFDMSIKYYALLCILIYIF